VKEIGPELWWWSAAHPQWTPEDLEAGEGWEQVVSSYALAADGLVFIDPLVESWEALDRLVETYGSPSVLITILWHVRSAPQILERYEGASVWAHEPAAEWIRERTPVTNTFVTGDDLPGGVEAVHMRRIEEVAYWLPNDNSVVVGDTILGHGESAAMCPPTWVRQSETIEPARDAVRELLERRPDRLLLTHGGPMNPKAFRLEADR
jgi:glyoxylase-like metal-dependent hydrolase (beta-lactamase superfamily II)